MISRKGGRDGDLAKRLNTKRSSCFGVLVFLSRELERLKCFEPFVSQPNEVWGTGLSAL